MALNFEAACKKGRCAQKNEAYLQTMHEKIFIVGFMASGKTTWGKQLAEEKGLPFVDTDALIEEKIGMSVKDFFAQWGEKYFRRMERDVLYAQLSKQESFVCATGGGSVCQPDIMDWLNRAGETIWLDTPWEVILERLHQDTTRPLAATMSDEELKALYVLRCGYYGKAGKREEGRGDEVARA